MVRKKAPKAYVPPYVGTSTITQPESKTPLAWDRLCLLYGRRIVATHIETTSGASDTLYTVPQGTIFLLTGAFCGGTYDGAFYPASAHLQFTPSSGLQEQLLVCYFAPGGGASVAFNPSIPLKMTPGDAIDFHADTTLGSTEASFGINGYEVNQSDFNEFVR